MNAPILHPEYNKLRVWSERILYVFLVAFVTISFWVLAVVIYTTYFDSPPIRITPLVVDTNRSLCPGDTFDIQNHLQVYQPTVLTMYVSVMDEHHIRNIPNTSSALPPRLHPNPAEFDQIIPWFVPTLPPGEYTRVVAIRGHDGGEQPLFIFEPFTVREDCHE